MVLDFYSFGKFAPCTLPCGLKMRHKSLIHSYSPGLEFGFVNGLCDLEWLGWGKTGLSHLLVLLVAKL